MRRGGALRVLELHLHAKLKAAARAAPSARRTHTADSQDGVRTRQRSPETGVRRAVPDQAVKENQQEREVEQVERAAARGR